MHSGAICQLISRVTSPLLDFVKELSKNGASEVAGQTARHVVSDEGLDDGLSEKIRRVTSICNLSTRFSKTRFWISDRVVAGPNQTVDLIVVSRLGVRVSVLSQRLAGIPVAC